MGRREQRPDVRGPIAEGLAGAVEPRDTDAVVEFTTNELTAYARSRASPLLRAYAHLPSQGSLIESKSLKLYLWSFSDRGIFAEDLAATLERPRLSVRPVEMTVDLTSRCAEDRSGPWSATLPNT